MKLTLLKISEQQSKLKDKGKFFYLFFKGEDGRSYKTCVYPKFGNYLRCGWNKIVALGVGTVIDITVPIFRNLISGDNFPKIIALNKGDKNEVNAGI